jgi:hypothetical protein
MGWLSQAAAAKKSTARRDGLSGMKLKREQATTANRNVVSLALKPIKASENWFKATADERKKIEKQKKEEVLKDRLVSVFITANQLCY